MIAPRVGLVAVAALAIALAWKRPAARPVALALAALAAIDCARLYTWAHFTEWPWGRVHGSLGMLWPTVYAALAWHAWRGRWWPVALAFALFAALPFLPVSWAAHPVAWEWMLRAPHMAAPLVAVVAWATKDEGPVPQTPPRRTPEARDEPLPGHATSPVDQLRGLLGPEPGRLQPLHPFTTVGIPAGTQQANPTTPDPSRAIASVLAFSGLLDVTVGALAPGATYDAAAPLAWATWIACGVVLAVVR